MEAIPEEATGQARFPTGWICAADVAETTYTPFQTTQDAAPVRLIVRRVKPTPGSQLAGSSPDTAITASSPAAMGKECPGTGGPSHRRHGWVVELAGYATSVAVRAIVRLGEDMARSRAMARLNWVSQRPALWQMQGEAACRAGDAVRPRRRTAAGGSWWSWSARPDRSAPSSGPGCGPSPVPPTKRRWRLSGRTACGSDRRRT